MAYIQEHEISSERAMKNDMWTGHQIDFKDSQNSVKAYLTFYYRNRRFEVGIYDNRAMLHNQENIEEYSVAKSRFLQLLTAMDESIKDDYLAF